MGAKGLPSESYVIGTDNLAVGAVALLIL